MKASDSDTLLNQLVVAALTVFIVVILLLAAVVLRQMWLQQRIAELSSDVQVSIEVLEETTEDVQRELAEIRTDPNTAQDQDRFEEVTAALAEVDEQLDSIEEDLTEATRALEGASAVAGDEEEPDVMQDEVDQVFTVIAVLAAIAGILIALLLGVAVRVQQRTLSNESHRSHEPYIRNHQTETP